MGPPPGPLYAWGNRFDDPERVYRTVECAREPRTCLYDVLREFVPDTAELAAFAGFADLAERASVASVPHAWLAANVLAPAWVAIAGDARIVDVDDPAMLLAFARSHAQLLAAHGVEHLDISELRTGDRAITRSLGRWLHDEANAAGVEFRSSPEAAPCLALFDDRAELVPAGIPIDLTRQCRDLVMTLAELELVAGSPRAADHVANGRRATYRQAIVPLGEEGGLALRCNGALVAVMDVSTSGVRLAAGWSSELLGETVTVSPAWSPSLAPPVPASVVRADDGEMVLVFRDHPELGYLLAQEIREIARSADTAE